MQIVDEVAAADDENALLPERCKALPDLVVERRWLSLVDAELNHWNIGVGIHVAQNRPRAVVESPTAIQPNPDRGEELLDAKGKL
jgi:hypothetical protein